MRIGVSSHGRNWLSSRAAGRMTSSLLRSEPDRDAPDDRQLAVGGEPLHVARRDGGVVDHHAGGLGARPARGGADVVDRGGRELGQRGDVVEQGDESTSHWAFSSGSGSGVGATRRVADAAHRNPSRRATRLRDRRAASTVGTVQRHEISHLAHAHHPVDGPALRRVGGPAARTPRPRPGGRVLDLGCGGGAWLRRALLAPGPTSAAWASTCTPGPTPGSSRRRPVAGARSSRPTPHLAGRALRRRPGGGGQPRLRRPGRHLDAVRRHLAPGGRVLLGDGIWDTPPHRGGALGALEATADEFPDLAGLVALAGEHGYEVAHGHVSTLEEWDEYEWSWTGSLADWALAVGRDPADRAEALAAAPGAPRRLARRLPRACWASPPSCSSTPGAPRAGSANLGPPASEEGPLGRVGRERQRPVVGGRRLAMAAQPAQQVGPGRVVGVVAVERRARRRPPARIRPRPPPRAPRPGSARRRGWASRQTAGRRARAPATSRCRRRLAASVCTALTAASSW